MATLAWRTLLVASAAVAVAGCSLLLDWGKLSAGGADVDGSGSFESSAPCSGPLCDAGMLDATAMDSSLDAPMKPPVDATVEAAVDAPAEAALDATLDAMADAPEGGTNDAPNEATTDAPMSAADAACGDAAVCAMTSTFLGCDPKNCGACGHSCQGGSCIEGQCQPVLLGSVVALGGAPHRMALDATNIYFTATLSIAIAPFTGAALACARTGCPAPTVLMYSVRPYGITVSGGSVFLSEASGVGEIREAAKKPDGGPSGGSIFSDAGYADGITAAGGYLVWGEIGQKAIFRCPAAGCSAKGPSVLASASRPVGIASEGTEVYWTEVDGGLLSCPLDGGAAKTLAMPAAGPAVDSDTLFYWVGDTLYEQALTPGSPALALPSAGAAITCAASDGVNVYVGTSGKILWCPKTGCAAFTQLATVGLPVDIAVDNLKPEVYWLASGGNILKVAKP